jgi:hypothetical protein
MSELYVDRDAFGRFRKRKSSASLADYQHAAAFIRARRDFERAQTAALLYGEPVADWLDRFRIVFEPDLVACNRVAEDVQDELAHFRTLRHLKRWQVEGLLLEVLNRRILELLEPDWTEAK